ncbi:helix-turn-helix domain-containing protein [Halalkalicoccus salilacus]|uniref:helix-turn-helix domain-containing protein n=1 Tax=Halalkalicoccus salilacus TaxID=3117459 RepID=UPI00300EE5C8
MGTIIEFRLPTEEFALEETLDTRSEAQIEIERVVADDPDKITPYIWVRTDDFEAFEAALEDDPTVEDVTLLSETEEERSYQMTWTGSIDFIVHLLTEHEGTITHADGSADGWELRVVFPDKESLSEAHDAAYEAGFRFDVIAVHGAEDTRGIQYGLTDAQRDAIVAAFEAGYFTVPREVTLHEFAEQQDSSHQSLSEQLRRATGNLVESTLITHSETKEE